MKLNKNEMTVFRKKAIMSLSLSADTKPEVTRRDLADFAKRTSQTLQIKRNFRDLLMFLVEVENEEDK